MDNFERIDKATRALDAGGYPSPQTEDGVASISDMIADLLHLAQNNGENIQGIWEKGLTDYGADTIEQAFQDNKEWDSPLQTHANVARAIKVLEAAGVPEHMHYPCLIHVGLGN
jgi:hypothetical protein